LRVVPGLARVSVTDIGSPRPVDREGFDPAGGAAPFSGPGGVLVGPHRAGVDAEGPLQVRDGVVLNDHLVEDAFQGTVRGPDPQLLVGGLSGFVALRACLAMGAGAQLPQDRIDQ
jgi:hypothetical protein